MRKAAWEEEEEEEEKDEGKKQKDIQQNILELKWTNQGLTGPACRCKSTSAD